MVFGHKNLEQHFQILKKVISESVKEQDIAVRIFHKEIVQRINILSHVAEHFCNAGLISKNARNNIDDAKNAFMALEMICQMYLKDIKEKKSQVSFERLINYIESENLITLSETRIKLLEKHMNEEDAKLKTIIKCVHEILHELEKSE